MTEIKKVELEIEEKAKEIGRKWYYDNAQPNDAAYRGAIQMAKWMQEKLNGIIMDIFNDSSSVSVNVFNDMSKQAEINVLNEISTKMLDKPLIIEDNLLK